jgi:predicted transcriptional regulator
MSERVTITEAEVRQALADAVSGSAPGDAMTVTEICLALGKHRTTVERVLRQFMAEGRLMVHRVPRPSIGGYLKHVPAYTINPIKPIAREDRDRSLKLSRRPKRR